MTCHRAGTIAHYDSVNQFGIKIETLDNPGWSIQVSIQQTELQDKEFQNINIERTENNWIFSKVRNGFFECNRGPFNLPEVFQIFRDWVESSQEDRLNDIID